MALAIKDDEVSKLYRGSLLLEALITKKKKDSLKIGL